MSDRQPESEEWRPWAEPDQPEHTEHPAASGDPVPQEAAATPQEQPSTAHTEEIPRTEPYRPAASPPITGSWSAPPSQRPGASYAEPPATASATTTGTTSGRRGPGWGALVGSTVAVGLLAGLGGGIVGAALTDGGGQSTSQARSAPSAAAPTPGAGATSRPQGSIANIAATALPSVVTLRVSGSGGDATGSGWVYDGSDHVVTNNHVVAGVGKGGTVTVVLSNGKQVEGKVVGTDASYDLAVVKVTGADLSPLPLGTSADVVVGDQVIAVGAPLGLDSTVTTGIVSALDRPVTPGGADDQSYINAIQTDAAINPGNSGGPLLDMSGRVIGVNSAIAQVPGSSFGGSGGNIGVGFAIPSDQVATTVEQLIETGKAVHPIIGVYLDGQYSGEGVKIADSGPDGSPAVNPDGPAAKAGLRAGDVIVAFDGTPVTEGGELVVKIRAQRVGDSVTLTVRRDGRDRDVTMVLEGSE